jgi:predicted nucleic acid-binding protein
MKIEITPAVVIPDMSPLIHLAAAGHLRLLQEFGRVIVMDIVAHEASSDRSRPWASEVSEWLENGQQADSSHPVEIVKTEIGEAYRLARQTDPKFRLRNAGESAIRDWLVDALPEIGGPALVVYEDKRVPKFLQRERLDEVVLLATTRALLLFAEQRGLIKSAEEAWKNIIKGASGANPVLAVQIIRPKPP